MSSLSVFRVNHNIDYPYPDMAPFDTYWFGSSAFVVEKATNRSLPIVSFSAGETADNFVISSYVGFPTKNNFTYDSGTGPTTVEVESHWTGFKARRSRSAQGFTLCLFIINWALTIGSIYITLFVVLGRQKMDVAVLLLPVIIVLIIPSIRNLYVGSPESGVFIGKFWALRP